jgi:hypothetical protein
MRGKTQPLSDKTKGEKKEKGKEKKRKKKTIVGIMAYDVPN